MSNEQNQATAGRRGLGWVDIEIDSASGTVRTDPNGLITMAFSGAILKLEPLPTARSLISGKPAVVYATDAVTLPLCADEVNRMVMRSLRPDEYRALVATAGMFHEIHDDFYDPETGVAMQPQDASYEPVPLTIRPDAQP